MKKILFILTVLVILPALDNGHKAWAASEPGYYSTSDQPDQSLLSPEELDDLLAPIALYPDPLIAQILPASTFIDQIDEAARYVRQYGRSARIDDQPWDLSVKAVAHYPDLLYMMDQKYDWTVSLGQAYLDQPQDVMDSIQALRAEAMDRGNLVSTSQQQVIVEAGDIRIVPAAPEYIYLPVYDPHVVYLEPSPSYGFITFGAGFAIGAWLSRDLDWREHRVYYHGWQGSGWVSRSRPHIQDRRGIYINRRAASITTNSRVRQHDTVRFRQELRRDVERRRDLPGRPASPTRRDQPRPGRVDQPRPGRVDQPRAPGRDQSRPGRIEQPRTPTTGQQRPPEAGQRPAATDQRRQPAAVQQPAATPRLQPAATPRPQQPARQPAAAAVPPKPARGPEAQPNVFRGRDVQREQPASRTGYGGYGSGKEAETYRERGQSSREKMREPNAAQRSAPAAPKATVAPAPRPSPAPAPARPVVTPAPAPAPRSIAPAPASRPTVAPAPRPHVPRPVMPESKPGTPEGRGGREQPRP